jgi:hypothetical protein
MSQDFLADSRAEARRECERRLIQSAQLAIECREIAERYGITRDVSDYWAKCLLGDVGQFEAACKAILRSQGKQINE